MIEKEFNENLSNYFNDGIGMHGEVEMINLSNNKVLFKKHNMIVQSGRNFIRDLFLKQLSKLPARTALINSHSIATFNAIDLEDDSSLTKIKFGSNSSATRLDMNDLEDPISSLEIEIVDDIVEEQLIEAGSSNTDGIITSYQIKVKINIDNVATNDYTLGELGLFYKNGTKEYMFSRVAFDPIAIGPGSSLQLTYYIYF